MIVLVEKNFPSCPKKAWTT